MLDTGKATREKWEDEPRSAPRAIAPVSPVRPRLGPLLFLSGACALVYQVAWFREFRLIFGASTAATAAVLALFTAGLGAGGLFFGGRADRHPNPAALYARLELGIAVSSAATPALLWLARKGYVALGGTAALGMSAGTAVRLVLSALVLAVPTFLMGGTLPSAARAALSDDDTGRRGVGWLYGVNTLGAVAGCAVANFALIEALGTRSTLWLASSVNVAVGLGAAFVARGLRGVPAARSPGAGAGAADDPLVGRFALVAAATVGVAFFVMEIVWYRMLGPILGGTIFTFGLILAVALLGIALGGAWYGVLEKHRPPTLAAFAATTVAEAVCMAAPYAGGDRVAALALALRPAGFVGFGGLVLGWAVVAAVVVLPAATVAGLQFPMLIGLLGSGRSGVGRQTGLAYASNTAGAIAGSLLGGFVLLPAWGALGCWRAVVVSLAVLGVVAAFVAGRRGASLPRLVLPAVGAGLAMTLVRLPGPSASWRHSPIGVGRVPVEAMASANDWHNWVSGERRAIEWETDGVESTVALSHRAGLAFVVNGKVDGHIRADAPTQVMSGMLGAILHRSPKTALVIGLGTGSSAGWLGAVPELEKIDVVELEPSVMRVAKDCAVVNRDVMDNPKVHVVVGDAREVLLTSRERYDLVFSEPSNPYRAGIASLFTREYYREVKTRLDKRGLFLQWVQAYDVDSRTVRMIYATLASVFPSVETWELGANDLLLVASDEPPSYDAKELRAKIEREPYRTALSATWRAIDLEGFLGHFVARSSLARNIAEQESLLNTDDRTLVEFAFARTANHRGGFDAVEVFATSRARGEDRPAIVGDVDWDRVEDERITFRTSEGEQAAPPPTLKAAQRARAAAQAHYLSGRWRETVATWQSQSREPEDPTELAMMAETTAELGDESAPGYEARLRALEPAEADAVRARLLARQGHFEDAMEALEAAFAAHRIDPWPWPVVMRHAVELAADLATKDVALAARAYAALSQPFAGHLLEEPRSDAMLVAAGQLPLEKACVEALSSLEPHVPWRLSVLSWRSRCYDTQNHALAPRAARELIEYLGEEAVPFGIGLTEVELR
jgi:spermidine synthase